MSPQDVHLFTPTRSESLNLGREPCPRASPPVSGLGIDKVVPAVTLLPLSPLSLGGTVILELCCPLSCQLLILSLTVNLVVKRHFDFLVQ